MKNGLNRLYALACENIEAGERLQQSAPRFLAYKDRHLLGTAPRAVTGFNLFQTPPGVAALMAAIVRPYLRDGSRILEPSAGLGRLVDPFKLDAGTFRLRWEAVEEQAECVRALRRGYKELEKMREGDFLKTSCIDIGGPVDAVIMNPPFKQGTDIKHILHARSMLNPSGVLVSLCYDGVKQNRDLKPICDTWEVLPANSFKESGTGAGVVMLTMKS